MTRSTQKSLALLGAPVLVIVGVGAAFAYWTARHRGRHDPRGRRGRSTWRGNLVAAGAVTLGAGAILQGAALSSGTVTLSSNAVSGTCGA